MKTMKNIEIGEEKLNAIIGFVPFEMLSPNGKPMLGLSLDVFIINDKVKSAIGVQFHNCEIKDGAFLVSEFGKDITLSDACENYIHIITGKTLVFDGYTDNRKEVLVI